MRGLGGRFLRTRRSRSSTTLVSFVSEEGFKKRQRRGRIRKEKRRKDITLTYL
jgi:hypothetical protein